MTKAERETNRPECLHADTQELHHNGLPVERCHVCGLWRTWEFEDGEKITVLAGHWGEWRQMSFATFG